MFGMCDVWGLSLVSLPGSAQHWLSFFLTLLGCHDYPERGEQCCARTVWHCLEGILVGILSGHAARAGALNYADLTVADVMTKERDVFMLDISRKLDFNTMRDIYTKGYTRIPVYEHSRDFIKGVLNVKDLILVNGDDEISLAAIIAFRYDSIQFSVTSCSFPFYFPPVFVSANRQTLS
jgi:hypothetical protein